MLKIDEAWRKVKQTKITQGNIRTETELRSQMYERDSKRF